MSDNPTSAFLCITNVMRDVRSCTHRGAHLAECDGQEYSWNEKRNRDETTGRDCKGCRPREARHGHVCLSCWERIQMALAEWPEFDVKIEGIERAVQRDNGGVRGQSIGYVPLPGTMLAVDEIRSYLKTMTGTADMWVETVVGAKDAIRFARAVPSAIRTHATEEKAHRVNRTRCTKCGRKTLVWEPAQYERAEVTVTCSNPECGARLNQASFEIVASIENPDLRGTVILDAGQTRNLRGDLAETFDPTRPDHEDLDPLDALTKVDLMTRLPEDHPRVKYLRKSELIDAIHAKESA